MVEKKKRNYFDLSNVEKQKNFLTAEEFPEGSYDHLFVKTDQLKIKALRGKKGNDIIATLIMRIKPFIRIFLGKWMVLTLHTMTLIVTSSLLINLKAEAPWSVKKAVHFFLVATGI